MFPLSLLFVLAHFTGLIASPVHQQPILLQTPFKPRRLSGRFLHLTDVHPDGHYRFNATIASACHSKKPKKDPDRAGRYGVPFNECDSPYTLSNLTFDWIEKEWADEIDFVIWTGDSARHDNDPLLPRTPAEIYHLNRQLTARMLDIFSKRGVPVVTTIGNNDVWPHNIMTAGPNSITSQYASIWKAFIPFPSYQIFLRGGYYTVDLIANQLAAISLNTMYFYDSNKAVGGCEWVNRDRGGGIPADPGNLELDWLEVQLDMFRKRGMKVWIIGHVPPSPDHYFPECYWRYAELSLRFQDTIVGHLFGHLNADHFYYIAADHVKNPGSGTKASTKKKPLHSILLNRFQSLKSVPKLDLGKFAIVNVAPSVVPNPYLPGLRIWGYNITGMQDEKPILSLDTPRITVSSTLTERNRPGKKRCKGRMHKNKWWCRSPPREWYSDENAPSRTNRPLAPLGYVQWWLPKLESNETPVWEIEYATYSSASLLGCSLNRDECGWEAIPARLLEKESLEGEDKFPFNLTDGTVGSWLGLAHGIGQKKAMQKMFRRLMYMGGESE